MSDDSTLPPRSPNTPRTWLLRAWAWVKDHPDFAWPMAAFAAGFLIGKVLQVPTLVIYGLMALAILGALGTIGYKVRESGKESVRLEWAQANEKAKADADAERQRQEAVRAAQDREQSRRLTDEKKRVRVLMGSVEAHIRAAGLRTDCRIPDSLLGDANAALSGGKGDSAGAVPSKPGAAAPAR